MNYNGKEYRIVKQFEDGTSYGYRDLGEERIEIIQTYMGESWATGPLSIRLLQAVIGYREFGNQVGEVEKQHLFNFEHKQVIEGKVTA